MRRQTLLALLLVGAFVPSALGNFHVPTANVPDRAYVLVMQGSSFNGLEWPNTPLLEAYLGERVLFTVLVPPLAEAHTFHLHGHPWPLDDGRVVDTFLLRPGDVHRFDVVAGGVDRHAGDWMYHCHVDAHVADGMWGVFRVYPYATRLVGEGEAFEARLDRLGEPVEGASLSVELDGAPVTAHVDDLGGGRYAIHAPSLGNASGALVVRAQHALGESVARATLGSVVSEAPVPLTLDVVGALVHGH